MVPAHRSGLHCHMPIAVDFIATCALQWTSLPHAHRSGLHCHLHIAVDFIATCTSQWTSLPPAHRSGLHCQIYGRWAVVRKPKTLHRPLEWIHIPKCGTSFGAVMHGYLCTMEETPYANPNKPMKAKQYSNCTYCGDRPKEGKHLGKGSWWDPKLRNLIPFSNKFWKDHRHRWHEYYAPYCDWSQTPHPPYSNHFPLSPRQTENDVIGRLKPTSRVWGEESPHTGVLRI